MLTLIIDLIVGLAAYAVTSRDLGTAWGVVCGVGAAMICQLIAVLIVRRSVGRINDKIQRDMETAQHKLQRKMQQFQQRPVGSPKTMQQILEKDQQEALRQALKTSEELRRFFLWSPMMKKQLCTMQMALYYQMRDFKKADELMKNALFFDARSLAMKLARMYAQNDEKLDRFYQKRCRRFKGEDAAFLASVYAWMLVKKGSVEKAIEVLVNAKKTTDHAVVMDNWERLVNGKAKHYSNAGFGDLWYSLYLEEPKVKTQRVVARW